MANAEIKSFSFIAALCAVTVSIAGAQPEKIASKPPMGSKSFNPDGVLFLRYEKNQKPFSS